MRSALFAPRRRFLFSRAGFAAALVALAFLLACAFAAPAATVAATAGPTTGTTQKLDSNSNPTPYYYAGYPGPPTWFWILGFGSFLGAVAIYFADRSVRGMKPK
jgi:hypothetical protein